MATDPSALEPPHWLSPAVFRCDVTRLRYKSRFHRALRPVGRRGGTCLRLLQTRGRLMVVELELLLHGGQPRLALMEGVPVADVLLEHPVQALVHLRVDNPPPPGWGE
ncbi:hypothetical protein NHX12_000250, partial [Muraenolepis orangiensis]